MQLFSKDLASHHKNFAHALFIFPLWCIWLHSLLGHRFEMFTRLCFLKLNAVGLTGEFPASRGLSRRGKLILPFQFASSSNYNQSPDFSLTLAIFFPWPFLDLWQPWPTWPGWAPWPILCTDLPLFDMWHNSLGHYVFNYSETSMFYRKKHCASLHFQNFMSSQVPYSRP